MPHPFCISLNFISKLINDKASCHKQMASDWPVIRDPEFLLVETFWFRLRRRFTPAPSVIISLLATDKRFPDLNKQ